jgi:hypothetical protein
MWRVTDIKAMVDAAGVTTNCELTPLADESGFSMSVDDASYDPPADDNADLCPG